MFGLVLADPKKDAALRKALIERLDALMMPTYCITDEEAVWFAHTPDDEFMIHACEAVMRPDTLIPAERLLNELMRDDPRPANALRRAVSMQLMLLPTLRTDAAHMEIIGGHTLGRNLIVPHTNANGVADCTLPDGIWTDLRTGETFETRFRGVFSIMELPVLVRANALLGVGVNDRSVMYDEADRITLHWFQPSGTADLTLADGTTYHAAEEGGTWTVTTDSAKPWRFIVHQDGEELLIR